MICPRCTVAEISTETQTCVLCGYSPGGVTLDVEAGGEIDEAAHRELAAQYQLETILSQDAGSAQYAARALGEDRPVVLHVFPRPSASGDAELVHRFPQEAAAAAALHHPHLVAPLGAGVTRSLLWCAQTPDDGETLAARLAQRGPLDRDDTVRLVQQIASALDHAHHHGVVHGDVGPERVLMANDAARVTGFVSGRLLRELWAQRESGASPAAAPERAVTPAADQYALAAMAFECLAGAPPPREETSGTLFDTPWPDLPTELTAALRRALDPDPAKRFGSIAEFAAALRAPAAGAATAAPARAAPPLLTIPAERPEPRAPQRLLRVDQYPNPHTRRRVLLAIAVVVGAFLVYNLWHVDQRAPVTPTVVIPGPRPAPATTSPPTTPAPGTTAPATTRPTTRPGSSPTAAPPVTRPAPRPATGAEPGVLFINATPWGEVFVDDTAVGTTPLAGLEVAPGDHRVRVAREGYRPFEQVVSVAPGQRIRLISIVLEPEPS